MTSYQWRTILDTNCDGLTLAQLLALWTYNQNNGGTALALAAGGGYGGSDGLRFDGYSCQIAIGSPEITPCVDVSWRAKIDDITHQSANVGNYNATNVSPMMLVSGDGSYLCKLAMRVTTTGEIDLYLNNRRRYGDYVSSIVTSAAGLVGSGAWHAYRFVGDFLNSGGDWRFYLDGTEVIHLTGDTCRDGSENYADAVSFGQGSGSNPGGIEYFGWTFDDFLIKVQVSAVARLAFKLTVS